MDKTKNIPGFTTYLSWIPEAVDTGKTQMFEHGMFPTALSKEEMQEGLTYLITLRELTMLHIMNEITDKPMWNKKVFDETISSRWRAEALQNNNVSEQMIDWVIAELQYKANTMDETERISVYPGDVMKSDHSVSDSIKHALRKAVASLENVPSQMKDYHPGSDNQVLDLVHPSLFPLVYRRSRILRDELVGLDDCMSRVGQGEVLPEPDEKESYNTGEQWGHFKAYSTKFQWLPCDVEISSSPATKSSPESQTDESTPEIRCKITSYINNLHPQRHKDLYSIIEEIIARAIPSWNLTLSALGHSMGYGASWRRIWLEDAEEDIGDMGPQLTGAPEEDNEEFMEEFWRRRTEWEEENRRAVRPEPGEFEPPKIMQSVDLCDHFADHGLQVIVKLANIELTPEKPEYKGGSWHVEGQKNEHICATALYYYDSENITESRLSFRHCAFFDGDINYEQDHHDWVQEIFGCDPQGPTTQYLGDVVCNEGRLLTFPNTLQHRVGPFRLADPTKPGHRKILALFLVDPNIRVISTANVPPQRQDWWREELARTGALDRLPPELQRNVTDHVEFPIHLEDAKALRLELMDERRVYVGKQDQEFNSVEFNLCEH